MDGRRRGFAIVLLAVIVHSIAIARTLVPAQDGLKFIRIAKQFQSQPFADVIRNSDQHPLYPAVVASIEPIVSLLRGPGPEAWRVAAQVVSLFATLMTIVALRRIATRLFDATVADLATLLFVLLPLPFHVGHETLSDALGLALCLAGLELGMTFLKAPTLALGLACGFAGGLGFLTRPETVIAPLSILAVAVVARARQLAVRQDLAMRYAALCVTFLAMVGSYALMKGEVSEKLALRMGLSLRPSAAPIRKVPQWVPPGLDNPRFDFSPKEETRAHAPESAIAATRRILSEWLDGSSLFVGVFAIWGIVRWRAARRVLGLGREDSTHLQVLCVFLCGFLLILVRHVMVQGYLSSRHVMIIIALSLPWSAAAMHLCFQRACRLLHLENRIQNSLAVVTIGVLLAVGLASQARAAHPSRHGHWAAGQWLRAHAASNQSVLDTRGWAAFVSSIPSYDYWHVRQAMTDSNLGFVVVGSDELQSKSARAATLRAVLERAGSLEVEFPDRIDHKSHGTVRVYRWNRPASWEGIEP